VARKPPLTPTKRTSDRPLALVPSGKSKDPTPRRFSLNTLRGIRRELGQVYRLAREGELDLAAACKLGYLLSTLAKVSESELLEDRLSRLERAVSEGQQNGND